MSITSGFKKTKKYRKLSDGNYQLQSEWTSASTVEMSDGKTVETAMTTHDTQNNITTFTNEDCETSAANEWTNIVPLTSGETHQSIFTKMGTMFRNIRYLFKELGTTDISSIGDGTVKGAVSTLNSNLSTKLPASASCNKNWVYSGQSGQPSWLWGSNDGSNCYVWNPSNFSVNYANSAGSSNTATYNANNIPLTRMVYSTYASQTSAFHTVQTLATFTDSDNAMISGSKGQYIFAISAFSDERLKTNVKDSKINALDIINQIKLREFDFIDDKYGQHRDIGYVAQELKEIIPDCVVAVPQDEKTTGYSELYQIEDKHLIPYLVKAIQEISDKINYL